MQLCSMLLPSKKNRILNWSDAYRTAPNTSSIFLHIQLTQNKWNTYDLTTIHTGYIKALKESIIQTIKGKLVLLKPILVNA